MSKRVDWWMENAFASHAKEPLPHMLIDLGYVKEQAARDRADLILKIVSKRNLQIAGCGRLLLHVPPRQVDAVLAAFSEVKPAAERPGYCWCSHTWLSPKEAS